MAPRRDDHAGRDARAATPAPDELDLLSHALALLGDRWSLVLIGGLLDGPQRYGDLQERVPGIAPNILSQRLKRLEEAGVVSARAYQDRPPRYLYELADGGRELAGAMRLLAEWGARHGAGEPDPPRHAACGTPLETRWYCPACREAIEEPGFAAPPGDGVYLA
jgi:DNA-binding HxlR family transcriptional regulator